MFQYKKYFDEYCEENKLSLSLSYIMHVDMKRDLVHLIRTH